MFGIVDNRQAEYSTGLYFKEYPTLPLKDTGERFKYREETKSARMQDVVMNLANLSTQKTIVTTYKIDFKVDGYVLLGDTLYRIMDVGSVLASPQTSRVIKRPARAQTLLLNRVSNALGLEI